MYQLVSHWGTSIDHKLNNIISCFKGVPLEHFFQPIRSLICSKIWSLFVPCIPQATQMYSRVKLSAIHHLPTCKRRNCPDTLYLLAHEIQLVYRGESRFLLLCHNSPRGVHRAETRRLSHVQESTVYSKE